MLKSGVCELSQLSHVTSPRSVAGTVFIVLGIKLPVPPNVTKELPQFGFLNFILILYFMCMCVSLCGSQHMCGGSQMPEEGVGSHGTGVAGCCGSSARVQGNELQFRS